ncbi:MAG: hypothetical protein QOF16_1541 [Actinomycetota bacterium]|nr:hypothetical protein [Actinomycetota bacterium]
MASAPAQQVVIAAPAAPATIDHSTTSKAKKQPTTSHVHHTAHKPPPPPQPDISLYVLYNAKTEDHYTTTSSATSTKMQSEGYAASVAGEGFSSNIQGTVAVALDSGTVYVYRSEAAAPTGESVNALYRLALDGDVYFTSNWSKAEQAATRGWSKQLVGYIY